jgi:hypothetical protein
MRQNEPLERKVWVLHDSSNTAEHEIWVFDSRKTALAGVREILALHYDVDTTGWTHGYTCDHLCDENHDRYLHLDEMPIITLLAHGLTSSSLMQPTTKSLKRRQNI